MREGKTVAVLGAFGLMAEAALHDLAAQPDVARVYAADLSLARAGSVLRRIPGRRKIVPVALDLARTARAARGLRGANVLLNCAWYELNLRAMDLALALRAHYVDLGGLYHMTRKQLNRSPEFRREGLVAALGCGSTPGVSNMMVARLAEGFETVDEVSIIDASHDPSLQDAVFLPPFSIRTMLDEYLLPAPVLDGGRIRMAPARGLRERLEFPAPIGPVTVLAAIHSELATLPAYLRGKGVRRMAFKIAYPEPVERQLAFLVGSGLASEAPVQVNGHAVSPRRLLAALAQRAALAAAPAADDFEVLRVLMTGTADGRPARRVWDCELRPRAGLSAGAMGVGCAGSIAALLCARGRASFLGAAGPETALPLAAFFEELAKRGICTLVERTERGAR